MGHIDGKGYGVFSHDAFAARTNREALALDGEIDDGLHALHRCHFRACCNPRHLYAGTPEDNNRDTVRAGRNQRFKPRSAITAAIQAVEGQPDRQDWLCERSDVSGLRFVDCDACDGSGWFTCSVQEPREYEQGDQTRAPVVSCYFCGGTGLTAGVSPRHVEPEDFGAGPVPWDEPTEFDPDGRDAPGLYKTERFHEHALLRGFSPELTSNLLGWR